MKIMCMITIMSDKEIALKLYNSKLEDCMLNLQFERFIKLINYSYRIILLLILKWNILIQYPK